MKFPLIEAFAYLCQRQEDKARESFARLHTTLEELLIGGFSLQIFIEPDEINLKFKWDTFYSGAVVISVKTLRDKLMRMEFVSKGRLGDLGLSASEFQRISTLLGKLKSYLLPFLQLNFSRYLSFRKKQVNVEELIGEHSQVISSGTGAREFSSKIATIEQNILQDIFKSFAPEVEAE